MHTPLHFFHYRSGRGSFYSLPFYGMLLLVCGVLVSGIFTSCNHPGDKGTETAGKTDSGGEAGGLAPVTFTTVSNDPLNEYIELNAVSAFLQKSYVKANTNGYLQSVDAYPGKYVSKGQSLFTLKTKEAQSIGNAVSSLDSSFRFSGMNTIRATDQGYITQLNHQSGDYVQDGEQLAVISDMNSFVFLMNMPYELRPAIMNTKTVELTLPDGTKLTGVVSSSMPVVDSASQTQNIVLRVNAGHSIPENLIARARILKSARTHTQSLPKAAILSDEAQTDFWVMKMTDSATAVKIPIKKGLETAGRVEVLSPVFLPGDRILVSGNYGLPDTVKVNAQPDKNP